MHAAEEHAAAQNLTDAAAKNITSFSDLPQNLLDELEQISYPARYPDGRELFVDGEPPRGVYLLRNERVKLFICSGEG